ncbi:MAG: type II toxin-antitoxin system RelE/ParE family toxin [Gammaproteobacteria bacterium]|nr:type II toxin-antitoxin system RelE/ParE family toxin [Gammaproteobacteria bacterium]
MYVKWTSKSHSDLLRLYEFLASVNKVAALRVVKQLTAAPIQLLKNPRMGEQLEEFMPKEVRRLIIGDYELRYEIQTSTLYVLRIWHTRENR